MWAKPPSRKPRIPDCPTGAWESPEQQLSVPFPGHSRYNTDSQKRTCVTEAIILQRLDNCLYANMNTHVKNCRYRNEPPSGARGVLINQALFCLFYLNFLLHKSHSSPHSLSLQQASYLTVLKLTLLTHKGVRTTRTTSGMMDDYCARYLLFNPPTAL